MKLTTRGLYLIKKKDKVSKILSEIFSFEYHDIAWCYKSKSGYHRLLVFPILNLNFKVTSYDIKNYLTISNIESIYLKKYIGRYDLYDELISTFLKDHIDQGVGSKDFQDFIIYLFNDKYINLPVLNNLLLSLNVLNRTVLSQHENLSISDEMNYLQICDTPDFSPPILLPMKFKTSGVDGIGHLVDNFTRKLVDNIVKDDIFRLTLFKKIKADACTKNIICYLSDYTEKTTNFISFIFNSFLLGTINSDSLFTHFDKYLKSESLLSSMLERYNNIAIPSLSNTFEDLSEISEISEKSGGSEADNLIRENIKKKSFIFIDEELKQSKVGSIISELGASFENISEQIEFKEPVILDIGKMIASINELLTLFSGKDNTIKPMDNYKSCQAILIFDNHLSDDVKLKSNKVFTFNNYNLKDYSKSELEEILAAIDSSYNNDIIYKNIIKDIIQELSTK